MFRNILDKFHKSNNQKAKLLKFKEFCELDKPIKNHSFVVSFLIEIRQKQTADNLSSIYSAESSSSPIYSEVTPADATNSTQPIEEPYSAGNDRIVYIQDSDHGGKEEDKTKLTIRDTINSLTTQDEDSVE
ncbi:uncharacterized protein J8A68_000299 [[Candida] subhashii]|uniref:Uncharacterized protein n=1 Tax=[Candida] subhashii TaxID=561895 RepID=A0A8J5V2E2_9ASCO|nr:uncharacterized protein J8A68_000299 [[Candida] subhashii]KAG7666170.1 hypothetical protein J8A68_000299 [[Candida] subhashii]